MYTLKVEGAFEAAHRVVNYPGKCDRLHGHNWKVEAVVRDSELFAITVYETPTSSVTYTRD